jgi:hypothetical protein
MPIVTPASFSPELLTTMRSALDVVSQAPIAAEGPGGDE